MDMSVFSVGNLGDIWRRSKRKLFFKGMRIKERETKQKKSFIGNI